MSQDLRQMRYNFLPQKCSISRYLNLSLFYIYKDQCINYTEDKYKSRSGGGISDKLSFRAKYNSFAFAVNLQIKSLQLYPLQFG